jgi:predicted LPLAT superfamily acyltransferase
MAQKTGVERQRGNRLGFWFFRTAVRTFGLGGAYGLLYFVCLYYLLVDRALAAAALTYVSRRFPEHGGARRQFDVYLLLVSQGKSLVDRYATAAGYGGVELELRGFEQVKALIDPGKKGLILLTAHVGNWQVAMTALKGFGTTVHLMMRPEDNSAVKQALNIDGEDDTVRVIYTDESLGGVIEAMKAINRGELVSIMGDRAYNFSADDARFLGGNVRFPYGAFTLAAAAQCPVVVLLSAKVGAKKYIVDITHIIPPPAGGRSRRAEEMKRALQAFADILEEYVAAHPYQWFVFRDIWTDNQ